MQKKSKKTASIAYKMRNGYNKVIKIMIASGILSLIVIVLLLANMLNYVQKVERADRAVKTCIIDVNSAARSIREMALNTDKSSYNTYESDVTDILNNVNSELIILKGLNTVDTDLYNQYSKALNDWGTIGYSIIKEIKAGNNTAATNDILNKCTPALDNVISIGDKLDADTDVTRNNAIWFTFFYAIAGIAAIIIFVIVAIVISKKTSKNIVNSIMLPLGEIEKVAAELTQGNLHSQLDYHSDDEIGQLAHNLRKSIRILSSYVDDIGHSMKEFSKGNFAVQPEVEWKGDFVDILNSFVAFENSMSDTVIGIQRAANEVSGGAGQVAESSNDLAQGATDQAAVVEELTASITNVAEQIDKNAESTKNISDIEFAEATETSISAADTESTENADVTKASEITENTESTEAVKDAEMPEILEPADSPSSEELEIELPNICSDIDFGDIDEPDNIVFPEFDYVVEPEIPDPSELPPIESNVISIFDEDWDDDDN